MRNTPLSPPQRNHWKVLALAGLVLALCWAQSLGLVHRISHAQFNGAKAKQTEPVQAKLGSVKSHSGLFAHFDAQPGTLTQDCRLLDQLGLAEQCAAPPNTSVPVLIPHLLIVFHVHEKQLTTPSFFEARGPPLTV